MTVWNCALRHQPKDAKLANEADCGNCGAPAGRHCSEHEVPPCINCGKSLEGPSYTGDCPTACDEDCLEDAWLKQPVREEAT